MSFLNFFIYACAGIGMTTILTKGDIFDGMRNFVKKMSPNFWGMIAVCPMCCGWWVGLFLSLTFFSPCGQIMFPPEHYYEGFSIISFIFETIQWIIAKSLDGCIISLGSWILHSIFGYLDKKELLIDSEIENNEINNAFIGYKLRQSEEESLKLKNNIDPNKGLGI